MVLMTTEAVAKYLAVSVYTVRALIRKGDLKAIQINSEYRIDEEDLCEFIDRNRIGK